MTDDLGARLRTVIVGAAGTGKTTQLLRLRDDARAAGEVVAYVNWGRLRRTQPRLAYAPTIMAQDILDGLLSVLPGALALPDEKVTQAFADYARARALLPTLTERVLDEQRRLGYYPEEVAGSYRAVRAMPPEALVRLCRFWLGLPQRVQDAPDAAAFLKTGLESIITLNAANVAGLRRFINDRLRLALGDDLPLFADPDTTLAAKFAAGLSAFATPHLSPLLLLDDYEAIAATPAHRILATALAGARVVVAGETRADVDNWAVWYVNAGYSRTDLTTNYLVARLGGHGTLTESLVAWLESTLTDAEARRHLFSLAIARRPDPIFLERLARRDWVPRPNLNRFAPAPAAVPVISAAPDPYGDLRRSYPFLFEPATDLNDPAAALELHPAVRDTLREYLRVERRRFSHMVQEEVVEPARDIAQQMLDAREVAADAVALAERTRDPQWQAYTLDVAWYRLWLDEAVAWVYIMPRYLLALAYSADLARSLAAIADAMEATYYNEGVELLPIVRVLATVAGDGDETGAAGDLDVRLRGLDSLEGLGQAQRGRWYKQENLGRRTGTAGSEEAEVRGIVFWQMGRAHAAAGRFDRAVQLYEQTLGMNVVMPELRREAARAHLRLAERLLLTGGSGGSGHTGFDPTDALAGARRAADLYPDFVPALSAVTVLSVQLGQWDQALAAAGDAAKAGDPYAPIYAVAALLGAQRTDEARARAETFANTAHDFHPKSDALAIFDGLIESLRAIASNVSDADVAAVRAVLGQ